MRYLFLGGCNVGVQIWSHVWWRLPLTHPDFGEKMPCQLKTTWAMNCFTAQVLYEMQLITSQGQGPSSTESFKNTMHVSVRNFPVLLGVENRTVASWDSHQLHDPNLRGKMKINEDTIFEKLTFSKSFYKTPFANFSSALFNGSVLVCLGYWKKNTTDWVA